MAPINDLRKRVTRTRRAFRAALARHNKALAKYIAARNENGLPALPPKFNKGRSTWIFV
jgi:hypothetical protein